MDPVSASCMSLHIQENARAILEEQKRDEKFNEIIVSCKSLSNYDGRTFRTLLPQITAAFIAAAYHIAVGIALSFSGILIPALDRNVTNATDDGELYATKAECSWIASVVVLVVPLGAITGGFTMDYLGRLNTIKLATIPTVMGWSMIALAQSVPMMIGGRFLVGIATSWGTIPATVYITEIARADMRGSLVSAAPSFASLGMVICFLKGWFLHWRTVAWMANFYAVIPVIFVFFIPESPAWLVSRGKIEQAAKSLRWINKYQPQPENRSESYAELQLNLLQKEHEAKLEEQARKGEFGMKSKLMEFLKPTGYKPMLILLGLFFFQQFSGIYIMLFYSVTFFQAMGSTMNPYLASIFIAAVRMLMSCANTYMLRTFSRRPLVMASGLGMCLCMTFSGLFTKWVIEGSCDQTWIPVLLLLLYVVASMIGLLPIPWTMTAELYPIEIRGVANSFSYASANLIMFGAIQSFWTLESIFGGIAGVQWFFAVISILGSVYTYILLPETHGKKLSEITNYFVHNTIFIGSSKNAPPKAQKKTAVASRVAKKDIVKSNGQNQKLMENV
ncbi:unnamed protein product [Phaedon cochleariae]|uniref:Major facilitator superfamily (MFS) profile domain-containing protein n=1 Tax=Phaedon cochleariae TaxID=80249 RepID=A0A9N9S9K6_PHACE|nr:unnamed protein product [Phaedon cochleariae]